MDQTPPQRPSPTPKKAKPVSNRAAALCERPHAIPLNYVTHGYRYSF